MEITIYILFGLLGLVFGSFAGAQVWRLRARQLVEDKAEGEDYDKKELKRLLPLTKQSVRDDRSRCLHCHHELAWYDLLPLVSWIRTKGKCRYCKTSIGWFEPMIEISTALLFVGFYHYWTITQGFGTWWLFAIWLVILVMLIILFVYDAKWFLLPDTIMLPLIGAAFVVAIAQILASSDILATLTTTVGSVAILGGIYLALWSVSKGAWVGFGDVKLGLVLGLLLGNWELAFLTLFLSNVFGLLLVLPGMVRGTVARGAHIPFGPMLILGFFVSLFFGQAIITSYLDLANTFVSFVLMV